MKSPFKLGLADYVLVLLTCLLALVFIDRWKAPTEDWLRRVIRGDETYTPASHPPPSPDPGEHR